MGTPTHHLPDRGRFCARSPTPKDELKRNESKYGTMILLRGLLTGTGASASAPIGEMPHWIKPILLNLPSAGVISQERGVSQGVAERNPSRVSKISQFLIAVKTSREERRTATRRARLMYRGSKTHAAAQTLRGAPSWLSNTCKSR